MQKTTVPLLPTIENMSSFRIKFRGDTSSIDANTLALSLLHTTSLLEIINKQMKGDKIQIKVKALEKGSFIIDVDLIQTFIDAIRVIVTRDNISTTADLIFYWLAFIETKKWIASRKVKPTITRAEDGDVTLIREEGNELILHPTLHELYYNPQADNASKAIFETLRYDNDIAGMDVLVGGSNKPSLQVDREEFEDLSKNFLELITEERTTMERIHVTILRPSFEKKLNWDVSIAGEKVSLRIEDADFLKTLPDSYFKVGDVLDAEVHTTLVYDDSLKNYRAKSHKIVKVYKHLHASDQGKLELR